MQIKVTAEQVRKDKRLATLARIKRLTQQDRVPATIKPSKVAA